MGLQDNRILSIPRHAGFVFKSFGLGRAFFFLLYFDFFLQSSIGCQHSLHQLEIRNKLNHNNKTQKTKQT